ncbi:hypothetical protein ACFFMN_32765 [Planobispora siamensis]|uniref:Uncharacterized protein n=1 Tax=Planobispora siamensis TaxID=936338 RepID=A0A8J3SDC1_9ACTN|nr:hypothetical protein [Planobispora siamensis]GIH91065.1 hypothetical protein Psi01_16950 [Planobispora siamensis]
MVISRISATRVLAEELVHHSSICAAIRLALGEVLTRAGYRVICGPSHGEVVVQVPAEPPAAVDD